MQLLAHRQPEKDLTQRPTAVKALPTIAYDYTLPLKTVIKCVLFLVVLARGGSSAENCSYMVQDSATDIKSPVTYTICPSSSKICRIRFDFKVSYFYKARFNFL